MGEACVRAAIYTDDKELFADVFTPDVKPNYYLLDEAAKSLNPAFKSAILAQAEKVGVKFDGHTTQNSPFSGNYTP